jgi:phage repressor protein C with HTH and peptisase S24 domain
MMSRKKETNVDIFARLKERIEQVREELGLSRMAFCRRIGFPYPRYHHITGERNSKPTADLLAAVAEHTDVDPHWLLSGEGSPRRGPGSGGGGGEGSPREGPQVGDRYVLLPLYNVRGAAGEGSLNPSEEVEDLLAFKREWISRELRSTPDSLVLIHVQGESMVPTLNPGDVILVERNHDAKISDGIYVIRMGEALLVKRLQFLPEGTLNVTSDNVAYRPFQVNLKERGEDFSIIGRVVWAGRRF